MNGLQAERVQHPVAPIAVAPWATTADTQQAHSPHQVIESAIPTLIITGDLRLRYANSAAIRLGASAGLTMRGFVRGEGLRPREWHRLRLAAQAVAAHASESALELSLITGTTWALLLRPTAEEHGPPKVCVFMTSLDTPPLLPRSWMVAYGLTPCEAEVCDGILRGASAGDIAKLRGVQEITVRCQVRAILDKVGVTSMRALCLKLSLLPR